MVILVPDRIWISCRQRSTEPFQKIWSYSGWTSQSSLRCPWIFEVGMSGGVDGTSKVCVLSPDNVRQQCEARYDPMRLATEDNRHQFLSRRVLSLASWPQTLEQLIDQWWPFTLLPLSKKEKPRAVFGSNMSSVGKALQKYINKRDLSIIRDN